MLYWKNFVKLFSSFSFLLLLSSCHVSSHTALQGVGGRAAYNVVLQVTNTEQMLLNLVRLRYLDTPFFLNVSNITTQFTYKASASPRIPIPGFNSSNPFVLGGELSWQNQPTIQYTPLEGKDFATQLLHPIDLHTIQQLVLSGWDIALVFRLAVQSFDQFLNAPEASGPIPEYEPRYKKFFEVTELFRYFQKRSLLQLGVKTVCQGEGKKMEVLQIAFPDKGKESEKLQSLLSSVEKQNGTCALHLEFGFNARGSVGIMPRSILSCMYYLSNAIHVPLEHVYAGKVAMTRGEEGKMFDWIDVLGELIGIHWSAWEPKNAYVSMQYRGVWFYIDDSDLISKRTFLLLLQMYNLQSQETKGEPPVLTLPLGLG